MPDQSRRIDTASAVCCAIAGVLLVGAPVAFVLAVPRCIALLRDFNVQTPLITQVMITACRTITNPVNAVLLFGVLGLAVSLLVAKEFTLKDVHFRLGVNIAVIIVVLAFAAVSAVGLWLPYVRIQESFSR